ncbi:hypothetical protein GJ496_004581 [Pomphorhynchus laevis]|nr:hypothetical protein GJ496_004581 [Pomphorhynchus laevis]
MNNTDLTPVYLNYYDNGSLFSKVLHTLGIGSYHYSVIVYTREYGLLSHPFYLCGIYMISCDNQEKVQGQKSMDKFNGALKLRQRYQVGTTNLSSDNVNTIVKRLTTTFTGPYFRSIEFVRKLLKILCGNQLNNIPWNFETLEWFSRSCCLCYPCAFSENEVVIKETLTYLYFKHKGDISIIMYELNEVSTDRMIKFQSKIDSMVKDGTLPKLQMYEENAPIKMLDLSHPNRKLADFSFSEILDTFTIIVTTDFIKDHAVSKLSSTSFEQHDDTKKAISDGGRRILFDDEKETYGTNYGSVKKENESKSSLFGCFGKCCKRKKYDKSGLDCKSLSYSFNSSNLKDRAGKYTMLRIKRACKLKRMFKRYSSSSTIANNC